jgi:rare lipoprotein A
VAGRHAVKRNPRTTTALIAVAAVLTALGVGGAVALSLHSGGTPHNAADRPISAAPADVDASRDADRADRGEVRGSESASPGPSASVGASPSPSAKPSSSPSRKPSPTPSKTNTNAGGGAVTSTGSCPVSYYDTGSTTANGEHFDPDGFTAANKTMPFNTQVRVTNKANGKSVVVRINDRGPYSGNRCIDLARGAFKTIASLSTGVIQASYEVLG